MSMLKNFRKPNLILLMASMVLYASCNQYDLSSPKNEFDYESFEYSKSFNSKIVIPEKIKNYSKSEKKYQKIIEIINNELGVNLELNELDKEYLDNFNKNSFYLSSNEKYLNSTDKHLIYELQEDLKKVNLETALLNFEKNVLQIDLKENEFEKYNAFLNVIKIINVHDSFFLDSILNAKRGGDCLDAILSYSIATIALVTCGAVPILCFIAIANKIRTFKNMIEACSNKK